MQCINLVASQGLPDLKEQKALLEPQALEI
jgi:hypothetical protein